MLVLIYIAAIVAANLIVARFGPVASPINAFLLIGLDLSLRDRLHDQWQGHGLWPRMAALIAAGSLAAWLINPTAAQIAVGSAVAFGCASTVDAIVYQVMRRRGRMVRMNGSNSASALVDSLVFPTIAFGTFLPGIVALQWAAKVLGGGVWAWLLTRRSNGPHPEQAVSRW